MLHACLLATLLVLGLAAQESRDGDEQPLTARQKAAVKNILAKYKESSLTATGARAINDAFRSAGLRRGPGLEQAIREAGFDPRKISALDPPPQPNPDRPGAGKKPPAPKPAKDPPPPAAGNYSIEQAVSDRAQLNTIAYDALAFLTGDFGSGTFLPPGKVSDYFGFQYMRDIDRGGLGHNTSFVPRVANAVLAELTEKQRAQLISLAVQQQPLIQQFAYKRFPLIKAFRCLLDGDLPPDASELDERAVAGYAAAIYEIDGVVAFGRATVAGDIISQLDPKQKAYLAKMTFDDSRTWPDVREQIDKRRLPPDQHVLVMTYASELFSWYAGSPEADVYFCPERHATYFGSFYMKDIRAMGNPDYSIGARVTGDSGEAFLAILTGTQRQSIAGLVESQRESLRAVVSVRRSLSAELRRFMEGGTADRREVLALSRKYGQLDGLISYRYAMCFAGLNSTLSPDQRQQIRRLRNLDGQSPAGAFLYSRAIPMPPVPDTSFLFHTGKAGGS